MIVKGSFLIFEVVCIANQKSLFDDQHSHGLVPLERIVGKQLPGGMAGVRGFVAL